MNNRIQNLRQFLQTNNLSAMLVTAPNNIFYLSGFTGSNSMLIIKRTGGAPIFYTDFRYQEQSRQQVKGFRIKIINRNLFANFPTIDLKGVSTLGFEESHLTFSNYQRIKHALKSKTKLIPCTDIIENLRSVKDNQELEKIKTAVEITDQVFNHILKLLKPNVTEIDIANEIEYQFKAKGATVAFPTIVAFAERSAMPHAYPTNRKLKRNDVVIFDIGAKFQFYCADMTRTVVFGKASKKFKELYNIVLTAQQLAEEKIAEGKKCNEIDGIARNVIAKKGYNKYFGHGLGHGVGIEVHEKPVLSSINNEDHLKNNQVVTIEPGIYLPNEFGIRIEDLVVVNNNGCEVLTKSPKELIEI